MSFPINENSIKLSFKIQENKNSSLTYDESSQNQDPFWENTSADYSFYII